MLHVHVSHIFSLINCKDKKIIFIYFFLLFQTIGFRAKDWGPAPRWVAFVDFFLASNAKHAVISGAHRRVGTTYAQLVAALAAANRHGNFQSFPWVKSRTV